MATHFVLGTDFKILYQPVCSLRSSDKNMLAVSVPQFKIRRDHAFAFTSALEWSAWGIQANQMILFF